MLAQNGIALLEACPEAEYAQLTRRAREEGHYLAELERETMGFTHAGAAALAASGLGLSLGALEALLFHPFPSGFGCLLGGGLAAVHTAFALTHAGGGCPAGHRLSGSFRPGGSAGAVAQMGRRSERTGV